MFLAGFRQEAPLRPQEQEPAVAQAAAPGLCSRGARIDHMCMSMKGFNSGTVTKTLNSYGLRTQGQGEPRGPMMTYISLRMPNRGGREDGTPELYFIDPDGLSVQLQDTTYCGGSGFLGKSARHRRSYL